MEPSRYSSTYGTLARCTNSLRSLQTYQNQKRYGRIFLTDPPPIRTGTIIYSSVKAAKPLEKRRYGQIFPNPPPSVEGLHSRVQTEIQSRKRDLKNAKVTGNMEVILYAIEKHTSRSQKVTFLAHVDKNALTLRDDLDRVRYRLRSIKSFDDMLDRGFLVNEKLNQYELTVRFSLTPKIARDSYRW